MLAKGKRLKKRKVIHHIILTDNKELSVDIETASSHCGIPTLLLKHIWAKAIDLLNSNQVLLTPGCAVQDHNYGY